MGSQQDGAFNKSSMLNRFLSGGVSATLTASLLQPLDVIKTTQQGRVLEAITLARNQHSLRLSSSSVSSHPHPSIPSSPSLYSTAASLVKEQGFTSLWKGLNATVIRVFFGAGIYFVALKCISDALGNRSTFAAGLLARCVATIIMTPVAVVKTRREWKGVDGEAKIIHSRWSGGSANPLNTLRSVAHIARTEGVLSLYSGVLPTLVRDAPFSGIFFAVYSNIKNALDERTLTFLPLSSKTFVAGLLAGATATFITHPADVLKTRLQIRSSNGSFADGKVLLGELTNILREEGPRGLLVGVNARVVKRGLSSALTWSLFEKWTGNS
jgi:solute carrier family 25 protein 38